MCHVQLPCVRRCAGGAGGAGSTGGLGDCGCCGPGVVASPELDAAIMNLDMSTITNWFSPLNPPGSLVSMVSVDQVPTSYDAPVVALKISRSQTNFRT